MALTLTKPPLLGQRLNPSTFLHSHQFTNVANSSTFIIFSSNYKKNSHKIRSQKVKDKNPNGQSGGMGFAALEAFKTDKKSPKNITAKTQKNDPQSMQKNEEKKNSIAYQEKRNESPRSPSSEDSDLRKNEDVLNLNSRASAKPSLRGEDIKNDVLNLDSRATVKPSLRRKDIQNDVLNLNSRPTVKPSLRGEDILLALQKASAQKVNEVGRRKAGKKNANREDSTRRGSSKMMPRVMGDVRPITVKPEWGARIESLENCLKELKERAEFA